MLDARAPDALIQVGSLESGVWSRKKKSIFDSGLRTFHARAKRRRVTGEAADEQTTGGPS
jgi:hypothetical protein